MRLILPLLLVLSGCGAKEAGLITVNALQAARAESATDLAAVDRNMQKLFRNRSDHANNIEEHNTVEAEFKAYQDRRDAALVGIDAGGDILIAAARSILAGKPDLSPALAWALKMADLLRLVGVKFNYTAVK